MKIVIDMNLSPQWVDVLKRAGHQCMHWSEIGSPKAPDHEILLWARSNGFVVFTHDLDFGAILAASVVSAFQQFEEVLDQGALVSIDANRARARILPLSREK